MPKTKSQKKVKYQPVLKLPPLPPDQYEALRSNIAVNGVLIPIVVDSDGLKRQIIDGNHRKEIADELGYDCPEIIQTGLDEDEKRTLARALNLARRQLTPDQKRELIAAQLQETPNRSCRWVGKMLGVHHSTVSSVKGDLAAGGYGSHLEKAEGQDGKHYPVGKSSNHQPPKLTKAEASRRLEATELMHGDCRKELKKIASKSIDAIITDPIYPGIDREYGKIGEKEWHSLMRDVVSECRRILKPKGSAIFILQPNYEKIGKMSSWLWDFLSWTAKEWNIVQDVWWWNMTALPTHSTNRAVGLLRQAMKMCIWMGEPNCYRNQEAVLWEPADSTKAQAWSDRCLRNLPSGHQVRRGRIGQTACERNGSTPFNVLPIPAINSVEHQGHPAATPYELASWWCRYILPPGGVLLDPFVGSGTMLVAALDHGASKVIGIDREQKYLV